MNRPAKKPARYSDILALPENLVGEIVDGELIVHPRPTGEHSQVQAELGSDLVFAFNRGRGGPGGWWIRPEIELHLGRDILVPDLSGWRRTVMPDAPRGPFITVAPQWICEVLSPRTALIDRGRKLRKYARHGVDHAWLIDTTSKTVEVLRREAQKWVIVDVFGGDAKVRAEPFDAVESDLSVLWLPEVATPAATEAPRAKQRRGKGSGKKPRPKL